jgi:hypothetical protein
MHFKLPNNNKQAVSSHDHLHRIDFEIRAIVEMPNSTLMLCKYDCRTDVIGHHPVYLSHQTFSDCSRDRQAGECTLTLYQNWIVDWLHGSTD